ncbi:disease resistance TIR-NBS-LRR class family protein, partial [Tanacetum coccineum]
METRVNDVVSSLENGIDEVHMIGIKGMGGAGKTTTARAVFDHLSNDFEAKSFVENVREVSKASMFDDGKNVMKERMCGKKVLIVLDDVDHIKQLKALAGEPKWFKPGSRILITTRDEQVLVAYNVNVIHDIVLLSEQEAISLFSRYAFGRESPLQGYEELSRKVVRYAAGLPLTVEVLGSFLCGKDKLEWEIFLDIVCILKGHHKEKAIRILESCGFHARNGLKVLEQRSLITISEGGYLGMHDHIEEMGKNVVRRSHLEEPKKHSRLWIKEEIEDILANDMGTKATRCLKLKTTGIGNLRISKKGLGKMKKLRYLEVNVPYCDFECDASQYFPNSLKYLVCWNYPFMYLPKTFQSDNLVGLDMTWSRMVQLWEEGEKKDVLKRLKFLSLLESRLTAFHLWVTPNLETLSLSCTDFEELHMSVACPNLKILKLNKTRLRSLDLELVPNLERLDLAECHELVEINAPIGCLKKVGFLNLSSCLRFTQFMFGGRLEQKDDCSSATLDLVGESLDLCPLHPNNNLLKLRFCCSYEEDIPSSVGNIEKLISFGLCACTDLKKISDIICSLQCLRKLKLKGDIPEFPKDLSKLECLEELCLSSTMIKYLPDSICMLKHLKSLEIRYSDLLEKLPEDLGRLECLEMLYVSSKKIEYLPDSICMLKHLKYLNLCRCALLEKLPEDLGRLKCLEYLDLTDTGISHLPQSIFGLEGVWINAPSELLQLYDFPS